MADKDDKKEGHGLRGGDGEKADGENKAAPVAYAIAVHTVHTELSGRAEEGLQEESRQTVDERIQRVAETDEEAAAVEGVTEFMRI